MRQRFYPCLGGRYWIASAMCAVWISGIGEQNVLVSLRSIASRDR